MHYLPIVKCCPQVLMQQQQHCDTSVRGWGVLGPFWANGLPNRDVTGLPRTKAGYTNPFAEKRSKCIQKESKNEIQ